MLYRGVGVLALAALTVACAPEAEPPADGPAAGAGSTGEPAATLHMDPPAPAGAFAPNWAVGGGSANGLILSWLEPTETGHRLRFAHLEDGVWSAAGTVVQGDDFFANWADFPLLAAAADGSLYAHWLARNGDATYAYGVELARSADGGASWRPLGTLHDDDSPTEHGFVSLVPLATGVQAFWLDGRAMADEGPMSLRTAVLDGDAVSAETVLDERVCECCQTGAALTARGPVVVYRDRSEAEVRDVALVGRQNGSAADAWSAPRPVADDGWKIPGCPVNGPVAAADGERLAVAWFTAAAPEPRVQVAFSNDAGERFAAPLQVDDGRPLGRVGLVTDGDGGAVVSWLEVVTETREPAQHGGDAGGGRSSIDRAELRLARVDAEGGHGASHPVARTSAARHSGVPRLARRGGSLFLAWVEVGDDRQESRVRVAEVALAALPAP